MKMEERINKYLNGINESSDKIKQIANIIKTTKSPMMGLRTHLEKLFNKKDVDFAMSPIAHFRIKDKGKTIIIVNKKYADKAEETEGELAIGYEGDI